MLELWAVEDAVVVLDLVVNVLDILSRPSSKADLRWFSFRLEFRRVNGLTWLPFELPGRECIPHALVGRPPAEPDVVGREALDVFEGGAGGK